MAGAAVEQQLRASSVEQEQQDWVQVKNVGDTEFIAHWNNARYRIPPNGQIVVQAEAAWLWVGNWNLRNVGDRRYRDEEFDRLLTRYGSYNFRDDDGILLWEKRKPRLEVYGYEGGQILTLVDDPDGTLSAPPPPTGDQYEMMRQQMEQLQRRVDGMKSQLQSSGQEVDLGDEPPQDEPRQVPVGPSKRARG